MVPISADEDTEQPLSAGEMTLQSQSAADLIRNIPHPAVAALSPKEDERTVDPSTLPQEK